MTLRNFSLLTAAIFLIAPVTPGAPAPERLTFEVAAIKPSQSAADAVYAIKPLPGGNGYTAQNVPFKLMMALMYKVPMRQIPAARSGSTAIVSTLRRGPGSLRAWTICT